MLLIGQCIAGRMAFKDGMQSAYWRPYLVIGVDAMRREVSILNISSTDGKEHKLLFPTNVALLNSMPPLAKPSFVKVDSMQTISFDCASGFDLLSGGALISQGDLNAVLDALGRLEVC